METHCSFALSACAAYNSKTEKTERPVSFQLSFPRLLAVEKDELKREIFK